MVSAIASASSSFEYSWSESRLKLGDLNSSTLRVLKCLLDDRNSLSVGFVPKKDRKNLVGKSIIENLESACVPDDRYVVSSGSGYAVLICWDEYVVLNKKLDTLYPMEVDMPYSAINQNSVFKKNN
ncbi:hypothetical protein Tco_0283832 [Tanacetum coccineum]